MRFDVSSGPAGLWKAPMEGGTPVRLTDEDPDEDSWDPHISPNGKLIAYFSEGPGKIRVIPFEGGSPGNTIDLPPNVIAWGGLRWTPDGRALTIVIHTEGVTNLWSQPIDGGPPKRITDFKAEQQISAFDWSRDGRLLVSRGVWNGDVVLMSGFR